MRYVLIFVLLGLLAGCTTRFNPSLKPHPQAQPQSSDQQQFIATVDQHLADGNCDGLQQLRRSVSVSTCEKYAEKLITLAEKQVALTAQLRQEKNSQEKLQAEVAELTQQNTQLSAQLEQLKKLLIEFERKAQ